MPRCAGPYCGDCRIVPTLLRIPVNVTGDSGIVTGIPVNVTGAGVARF